MSMRLLCTPRRLDGGEVRDVLGHDASPFELGVNEELGIREAPKLGDFLYCERVNVVGSERDGDGGRIHFVDHEVHP